MPTIEIVLKWKDGRTTLIHMEPDDFRAELRQSGPTGNEHVFLPAGETDEQGREIWVEQ